VRNTGTIALKEIKSYLTSPMAYVVTGIFLVLTGTFFTTYLAATQYTDTSIRGFVESGNILLLLFAAILTMRLIAEERKLGTWELLLTAPVRDTEVIMGKFLGSLAVLVGMLVLTLYYPILLIIMGDPDMGPIGTSYLGLFLLGSASLAVGIFASSLTSNQIVAAVVAGGILFALWFVGMAANFVPEALGEVLSYLSLSYHFNDFIRGIVDTRAIIYYISVTALFLYLAIRSLETSRWG
jgi:ABC-2 type transport system permease protein